MPDGNDAREEALVPPIRVHIANVRDDHADGFTIPLPASREALRPFLEGAEIKNWRDIKIEDVHSEITGLGDRVYDLLKSADSPVALNELNLLAAKLIYLDKEETEVFAAALSANLHCGSIAEMINLAENLSLYDLQPAYDARQYGEFLQETLSDNTSVAFERLEKSANSEDRALAAYILRLEAATDHLALGRAMAREEHGVFTSHGYIREAGGEFNTVYRDPKDIPAEYRVFDISQPPLIAANSDLSAFVMKTHALGGDFMADAAYNLSTMEARRSAEYLMIATDDRIFITEAALAYHHGSTAYDTFLSAADNSGAKAYALHVTEVHHAHVEGDIVAIDAGALCADIHKHCIHFAHVTAMGKDGQERHFTPEQWDAMEPIDRDQLATWTRHFDTADQRRVRDHLEDTREEHAATGKAVPEADLLANLNQDYMSRAENPQPDMIRVTLPAAREMLARGDAQVYRLMDDGPKEMSPLEAMPSRGGLQYTLHREFAIYGSDMAGLEKWAGREADALTAKSQPEHAREKPKTHGPELS
jgi:hypothetical protein